jgi:hypothetical protein
MMFYWMISFSGGFYELKILVCTDAKQFKSLPTPMPPLLGETWLFLPRRLFAMMTSLYSVVVYGNLTPPLLSM